jgi:hypothetical protein
MPIFRTLGVIATVEDRGEVIAVRGTSSHVPRTLYTSSLRGVDPQEASLQRVRVRLTGSKARPYERGTLHRSRRAWGMGRPYLGPGGSSARGSEGKDQAVPLRAGAAGP